MGGFFYGYAPWQVVNLKQQVSPVSPVSFFCVCVYSQSQDGRFEVRGRHGKSVLTISGVRLADLGRFDCEALSRIGGHQKSMYLDIECECF